MILQALTEFRERVDEIVPAYHKAQRVRWFLEVGEKGEFLGFVETGAKKKDWTTVVAPYAVRSGKPCPPYLLVDKPDYVLGLDVDGKSERAAERYAQYVALVGECADKASHPKLDVYLRFLDSAVEAAREEATRRGMKAGDLIAPRVAGKNLAALAEVREFWQSLQEKKADAANSMMAECLNCGRVRPIARTHPVELVVGPDRVSLISGNQSAFLSYGLEQSEIAPLCAPCALQYGEALHYLLSTERHHLRVMDSSWVYWSKGSRDLDIIGLILEPDEDSITRALNSVRGGRRPSVEKDRFYALALSANVSRMVVRSWITVSLTDLADCLDRYFRRQEMLVGGQSRMFGLWSLAGSVVREPKDLPAWVSTSILQGALTDRPVPLAVLRIALQRARVEPMGPHAPARAALIKLVLLSQPRSKEGDLVMPELRPDHPNPAYQCGRLLALLDDVQRRGVGAKATVVDRYYGAASAAPASVFGVLLRGVQPHLAKLRKKSPGLHRFFEASLGEVMGQLDAMRGFPRTLSIEEQGLFALGFYQQKYSRKSADVPKASAETGEEE